MNRTFHQRFSPQGVVTVVLLAVTALWCFLVRTGVTPTIGFVCMLIGAAAVDRIVNTTYVFTPDGQLVITRGRLAKRLAIPVGDIIDVHEIRGSMFIAPHIIIEYGATRHMTSAQPTDFEAFIAEIKRRQRNEEKKERNKQNAEI